MANSGSYENEIEESGLISAIWILACNDETSFMLYESIKFRLGLPDSYDVKRLIRQNAELFRHKIPKTSMKQWKADMLEGKRRPSFLIEMEDVNERKKIIESLTPDDGFRSQFRTRADSPRSDISIINWGLEHIERLRKARLELKEGKIKRWKEVWIPLVSIFSTLSIAVITIIITSYWNNQNMKVHYQTIQTQKELKELELSYKPKLEGYLSFLQLVDEGFDLATKRSLTAKNVTGNSFELSDYFRKIDSSFYTLEPFLKTETKLSIEQKLADYKKFLSEVYTMTEGNLFENVKKSTDFSNFFRDELSNELFYRKEN